MQLWSKGIGRWLWRRMLLWWTRQQWKWNVTSIGKWDQHQHTQPLLIVNNITFTFDSPITAAFCHLFILNTIATSGASGWYCSLFTASFALFSTWYKDYLRHAFTITCILCHQTSSQLQSNHRSETQHTNPHRQRISHSRKPTIAHRTRRRKGSLWNLPRPSKRTVLLQ